VPAGPARCYVPQEPVFAPGATVFDAVAEGVAEARAAARALRSHAPARTWMRCRPASRRWTAGPGSSA
jgi:hypothetical protein